MIMNEGHLFHKVLAASSINHLQFRSSMIIVNFLQRRGLLQGRYLLSLAILLALGLSTIGITWGRYQDWHFDEIAYIGIRPDGMAWHYLKPPLHTYLTEFLVIRPIQLVAQLFPASPEHPNRWLAITMVSGHLFTILLFCGSILLLYGIVRKSCGVKSASILALVMATSAGILQFNHWGTVDSPLLFWMLASLSFSIRASATGALSDSILAGILAGLAAADKYNGLGVAVALPIALLMHSGWRALYRMPLILGCLAVPLGFLIGCPGAIFDHERFVQQFLYNLYTTPVYYGNTHKLGYLDFLTSFPELIGLPASIALAGLVVATLLQLKKGSLLPAEKTVIACVGIVFIGYYINIGSFPRMEARFVLPVVPFALILAAPALQRIRMTDKLPSRVFSAIFLYNLICCVILGVRFLSDPRMDAQLFAMKNFSHNATVENTYAPEWNVLPGVSVQETKLTCDCGYDQRFTKIFGSNTVIRKGLKECASHDPADVFTVESLKLRNPDFIAFSWVTYVNASDPKTFHFYKDLEDEKLGYIKVFDKHLMKAPIWAYPRQSDALMPRMVILQREAKTPSPL
jgi:hypothetical protein